jgi:Dolichyl-phosphate-mannose-protein mannosyltransferase
MARGGSHVRFRKLDSITSGLSPSAGATADGVEEHGGGRTLWAVLLLTLMVRVVALDQPIVENYVGRQVPTAMVARNLERGSGFLQPSLDVAPFPNRFLVEPPLYGAVVVAVRKMTGLSLEASGRLVSALGMVLAVWGLYALVAARSGRTTALVAAAALAAFPVTIRYGRSFQPDALMLGCLVGGLSCWDRYKSGGRPVWLLAGFVLTSAGLALKVISAYVLLPLLLVVIRRVRPWKVVLALATLTPAILWYIHAARVLNSGGGSLASADNGGIWARAADPFALLRPETARHVVRYLGVRAFTPLGPPLAVFGLLAVGGRSRGGRLWWVWGAAALVTLAVLASKLHHEYYWLALAPVVAAGVGSALVGLARQGRTGAVAAGVLGLILIGSSGVLSASTWVTPPEWQSLGMAAAAVRRVVPSDAWVAAPEALLFAADRRGCRIEFSVPAARRAAREWRTGDDDQDIAAVDGPIALVEFYRRRGARYFADVSPQEIGPSRLALHEAVRRRYNVMMDRSGVFLAALDEPDFGASRPDHVTRPR